MGLINKSYYALGTEINLSVNDPATENDLEAGYRLIQKFEDKLTVNRNESEVMSIIIKRVYHQWLFQAIHIV